MAKYVTPEIYNKYKHLVLEMSPAIQYYDGLVAQRETSCLSDREIAARLGLNVEDVTEIRCIAEVELLPVDAWLKSANWKREKARNFFKNKKTHDG